MDIDKFLEEQSGQAYEYDHDLVVIPVSKIKELLKTHTLVPNEPTDAMFKAFWDEYENRNFSISGAYKAMLKASQENNQ